MVARIGSWQDSNLQIKAGRETVKKIDYYIKNDVSFYQETTLSGKTIIKNINKAKEKRYVESLLNLNKVIKICDEVNIYDNTNEFIQLINIKNGKLIWRDKIIPEWANIILKKL